jgi:cytochrome c553
MSVLKRSGLFFAIFLLTLFLGSAVAQDGWKGLKGDPAKGKEVFEQNGCFRCHDIETGKSKRPPAPSLWGVFERPPHVLADGTKHDKHTDAMLVQIITEGTSRMSARGAVLTDEELSDLLAFLHSMTGPAPKPSAAPTKGKAAPSDESASEN